MIFWPHSLTILGFSTDETCKRQLKKYYKDNKGIFELAQIKIFDRYVFDYTV